MQATGRQEAVSATGILKTSNRAAPSRLTAEARHQAHARSVAEVHQAHVHTAAAARLAHARSVAEVHQAHVHTAAAVHQAHARSVAEVRLAHARSVAEASHQAPALQAAAHRMEAVISVEEDDGSSSIDRYT